MRKLQSQGVHHITIVGPDRRTSTRKSYRFEPPGGFTHAEVLLEGHIETLVRRSRGSLSDD